MDAGGNGKSVTAGIAVPTETTLELQAAAKADRMMCVGSLLVGQADSRRKSEFDCCDQVFGAGEDRDRSG